MAHEHGGLRQIEFLLGTWRGGGEGDWPGADHFVYEEEIRFEDGGAGADFPFFSYLERSWDPQTGETLHKEAGFWRCHEGGAVDAVLSHPVAVTEVTEGRLEGSSIVLSSKAIARASESDPVTRLERRYAINRDTLTYELEMATEDVVLTHHLSGRLERA
ncbi:MAG: FABP family protein [Actinomycetota bacterium]